MNVALILAGGVGNRLGAKIPKQFIEVLGKPVLAYTIEAFENHAEIDAVLVVCVKPYIDYMWEMKDKYDLSKLKWVTEGGATFQESVLNGVRYLEGKIDRDDIVLVHFGASPFITGDIISDAIRVCKEKGNAISTTDYYILSGKKYLTTSVADPDNYSEEYIDRETIAVMNSPHAFNYGFIDHLYKEAIETGVINKVEPHTTTLMYALGRKIYFSYGSQNNIKITRKEDLDLFEGYVLQQERYKSKAVTGDVIVPLADGFEECEALIVVDILRRAGLKVVTASINGSREVLSSRKIGITADALIEDVNCDSARLLFLPGGRLGTENLRSNDIIRAQCQVFAKEKKLAAICAAPSILSELGLVESATCHPDYADRIPEYRDESVVVINNITTGQGLGATFELAFELVKQMAGEDKAQEIKEAICFGFYRPDLSDEEKCDKVLQRVHCRENWERWNHINMALEITEAENQLKQLMTAFFVEKKLDKYNELMRELDKQGWE